MTVIAVFNQKGGVGKTTTCLNLLAGLAQRGAQPIGIDLDPQAHLSTILGGNVRWAEESIFSFFTKERPLNELLRTAEDGSSVIPAHLELAKLDTLLGKGYNVVTRLRLALRQPINGTRPVIIDCSPLLGVLTLNALFACDLLLIPVSADYLAMQAAQQVEHTLKALEPVLKTRLARRYVLTRFDRRRKMSQDVALKLAGSLQPNDICMTKIMETVALAESPAQRLSIFSYAPTSQGAENYRALLEELLSAGLIA